MYIKFIACTACTTIVVYAVYNFSISGEPTMLHTCITSSERNLRASVLHGGVSACNTCETHKLPIIKAICCINKNALVREHKTKTSLQSNGLLKCKKKNTKKQFISSSI